MGFFFLSDTRKYINRCLIDKTRGWRFEYRTVASNPTRRSSLLKHIYKTDSRVVGHAIKGHRGSKLGAQAVKT